MSAQRRVQVAVRFDSATITTLDLVAARLSDARSETVSRSDVVREAVQAFLR
jgi:metal-responsive CopG/Arc/MetJ family transcriptional regulator